MSGKGCGLEVVQMLDLFYVLLRLLGDFRTFVQFALVSFCLFSDCGNLWTVLFFFSFFFYFIFLPIHFFYMLRFFAPIFSPTFLLLALCIFTLFSFFL